ncbi:MAG: hypothetical protein ACERKO_13405, partial [Acetanaerobacterium sp.]
WNTVCIPSVFTTQTPILLEIDTGLILKTAHGQKIFRQDICLVLGIGRTKTIILQTGTVRYSAHTGEEQSSSALFFQNTYQDFSRYSMQRQ